MTTAYISLGSNMGDSLKYLNQAEELIASGKGLNIIANSEVYLTEPQGIKEQNWFYNQVMRLECNQDWTAQTLLNFLQGIELKLGRTRSQDKNMQHGPRCIDLDLLIFGKEIKQDEQCTIPHPRMHQRAFVLIPLREVARQDILPVEIENCLKQIKYKLNGQKIYQD